MSFRNDHAPSDLFQRPLFHAFDDIFTDLVIKVYFWVLFISDGGHAVVQLGHRSFSKEQS